jgi:hypothetical protein
VQEGVNDQALDQTKHSSCLKKKTQPYQNTNGKNSMLQRSHENDASREVRIQQSIKNTGQKQKKKAKNSEPKHSIPLYNRAKKKNLDPNQKQKAKKRIITRAEVHV